MPALQGAIQFAQGWAKQNPSHKTIVVLATDGEPNVCQSTIQAVTQTAAAGVAGMSPLPHLALPVLVESHQAAAALRWAVAEMDRRYKMFSAEGVRNIAAYNEKATQKLVETHETPVRSVGAVVDTTCAGLHFEPLKVR